MASHKDIIIEWLISNNVESRVEVCIPSRIEYLKKAELMELVNFFKPQFPKYVFDEIAKTHGYVIIRIPP